MENKNENIDSQMDDQQDSEVDFSELEVLDDEMDIDALREKAKKAFEIAKSSSQQNKQLFARTKKAEGFVFRDGKWVKPEPRPEDKPQTPTAPQKATEPRAEGKELTPMDTFHLAKAGVHEDDIGDVVEYAALKRVSIAEALNATIVKNILAEKAQLRATANATNTGKARSGNAKLSGEELLEKAKKTGELPDSQEALEAMIEAGYKK